MVPIDNFDKRQFVRCPRCNGVVARTDLGVDGICHACKTIHKQTSWEASEQRRMERVETEAQKARVICPVCDKEQILIEERKRCNCGYVLRKSMSTS